MSAKSAIKRIINKDIKEINNNKLNELGIFVEFDEENFLEAKAMIIGPKDSVYEGGVLFFKLFYPKNYPHSPPDVCYVSRNRVRIHPNLYTRHHPSGHGKVCLSILGTWHGPSWTSIMDTSTVLLTIQSLLDNKPLYHEPGVSDIRYVNDYNKIIKHETIKTLFLRNSFDIPEGFMIFKDQIDNNVSKNSSIIYDKIMEKKNDKYKIRSQIYRFEYDVNYEVLEILFKENINKI